LTINDGASCTSTYCDSSTYLFRPDGQGGSVTIRVVTEVFTGISEQHEIENKAVIYPNPSTNYFTIKFGDYKNRVDVIITDVTGKIIFKTFADTPELKVNTKNFAEGIYIARIQSGDFIETKKLIIKK